MRQKHHVRVTVIICNASLSMLDSRLYELLSIWFRVWGVGFRVPLGYCQCSPYLGTLNPIHYVPNKEP